MASSSEESSLVGHEDGHVLDAVLDDRLRQGRAFLPRVQMGCVKLISRISWRFHSLGCWDRGDCLVHLLSVHLMQDIWLGGVFLALLLDWHILWRFFDHLGLRLLLSTLGPSWWFWHFSWWSCRAFGSRLTFRSFWTLRSCRPFVSLGTRRTRRTRRPNSSRAWRTSWPWRSNSCLEVEYGLVFGKQHLVVRVIDSNLIVQVRYFHGVCGQFFCHSLQKVAPLT
mmetsp:Transcript_36289/g.81713  ORF Transcript_36289/g.81713 Transcript_36289/m.81713 type:complete len:224 (-) Transcript_36289:513-1184(-)